VNRTHSETGFSLIELIVAMGVLLTVSSIVTTALLQMTNAQATIWNRTEMHSGIRGATELLQQEVGQAGRVTLPGTVTLAEAIDVVGGVAPAAQAACNPGTPLASAGPVQVATTAAAPFTAVSGMWAVTGPPNSYIALTTLDGDNQETVMIGAITSPATITACFSKPHAAGTVLAPLGGFATGIIPPEPPDPLATPPYIGYPNGSTSTKLKMFGDINGDGDMMYVEYTCDTSVHKLYRQVIPLDSMDAKLPPTDAEILLNNIQDNPGGTDCFKYQTTSMLVQGLPASFTLDVAITLTVQTEQIDPVTRQYQLETKALLNVSPRNVFNAWSLASIGYTDRIQSTPVRVTSLLP
jgi:prepilin-type N-terminal cleavage/methylation domain-containing protein